MEEEQERITAKASKLRARARELVDFMPIPQPALPLGWSLTALMCALFASAGWSGTPPAHRFNAYLVEGYGEMADAAAQTADNKIRTSFFRERKRLAERGEVVAPVGVEGHDLDPFTRREAGFARRQLVEKLGNGAREKQPLLAAIAQVNFDCWVAPSQAGSSDRDECLRRFYFAFAGLRAKYPAAVQTEAVSARSAHRVAANPPPARATVPSTAQITSASPPPASPPSSIPPPAEAIDPSAVQRTYAPTLRPELSAPAAQPVAAAPPVAAQTAAGSPPPATVTAPSTAQIASARTAAPPPSSIAALVEAIDPSAVQQAYATTLRPELSAPAAQPVAAAPPVAAQTATAPAPP
jgi:hypothetical protein